MTSLYAFLGGNFFVSLQTLWVGETGYLIVLDFFEGNTKRLDAWAKKVSLPHGGSYGADFCLHEDDFPWTVASIFSSFKAKMGVAELMQTRAGNSILARRAPKIEEKPSLLQKLSQIFHR